MKPAPAMKTINGKQCVRLIDLAKAWDTTTSNILAASKPHHIPEKYLHRIDGRVWCDLEGLRYRLTATGKTRLTRHIREFLGSLEKPTEPVQTTEQQPTVAETGPQTLDSATERWITNSGHLATQAFAEDKEAAETAGEARHVVDENTKRIGWLEARMNAIFADTCDNTKLIDEHLDRLYKLENIVNKLKPCRDHVARHQSASATVVSDKNTVRIQELKGKLDGLADAVHGNQVRITDTAADVHVAKQTANTAFARAEDNKKRVETLEKQMDAAELVVKSAANIAEEASEAVDRVETTAQQASDLAQENADIVGGEIERLTKQKERIDRLEKHNTVVEALLAISILVGTVGIGGVIGCVMKFLH